MKRALAYVCGVVATAGAFSQVIAGCNTIGDVQPTDASAGDSVRPDSAPPACAGETPVMKVLAADGTLIDPDWSCYATDAGFLLPLGADADADPDALVDADLDALTADADLDATSDGSSDASTANCRFRLTDFVDLAPVGGASVDLFFHNDLGQTPDFQGVTADKSAGDGGPGVAGFGEFFFATSSTPLVAYRVNARSGVAGVPDLKTLVWLDNKSCKPGATWAASSITKQAYDLLGNGLRGTVPDDPMKMTAVVGVRDCQYRDVTGGIVELFDDTTGLPLDASHSDFRGAYFNAGGLPDSACTHTSGAQALYAGGNVPTDRPITARVSGRMSASDTTPVQLGERKFPQHLAGAIVIVRPYRLNKD